MGSGVFTAHVIRGRERISLPRHSLTLSSAKETMNPLRFIIQNPLPALFLRRSQHSLVTTALWGVAVIISTFVSSVSVQAEQAVRPNIILIMADDLGYGGIGCFGQEKIKTPNIDRIAAEGIKFSQCYAGSHVCQPSRSVLMTGLHTGHTPVRANDTRQFLLPEHITVAEKLKEAGYRTGGFGKWGLGYQGTTGHPNRQGFDEFFGQYLQVHAHFYYPFWIWRNEQRVMLPENSRGKNRYINDEIHHAAMDFIKTPSDQPFFAYIPYIIPHVELVVPEDSEVPYRGQFPKVSIQDRRKNYLGSEDGLTTLAGMVSRMDANIGEILSYLDEQGLSENTLILFTSDNGGQNGGADNGWTKMTDYFHMNGSLRGYKGMFYEGGIRVPLVARWPKRVAGGQTSEHVLAFWDMMPTLCEAASVKAPENIDGISFLPALTGKGTQPSHDGLYWEYVRKNGIGRAARMGDWKAVQANPEGPVELYDLHSDVSESKNVAANHPEVVARLTRFMDESHVDQAPFPGEGIKTGVKDYVNGPWIVD